MGRSKEEISREKEERDHSSRHSITVDFSGSSEWDEWLGESFDASQESKKPLAEKPKKERKKRTEWKIDLEKKPLTEKQERFCQFYIELNNGEQAAIKAGYSPESAANIASTTLRIPNVAKRIKELRDAAAAPHIATASEVMQFFSDVMTGQIKDQFGLDASLADRTRAAIELAKRTVDLDHKMEGKADAVVEIKLDWKR